MPGIMLFIFYSMPSGLTLYVMASTFAGVVEQYVIRGHIRKKEALEAAAGAWKDRDHPDLKQGAAKWVKKLRREYDQRFAKLTTG